MNIITYLLIAVEVICSALLLMVILVQRTKNQGLGLAIGGGMGESMFGAQMGNVLTKTTVILAVIFLVTTTLLAMLGARRSDVGDGSVVDGAPAPVPMSSGTPLQAPMGPGGGVSSEVALPVVDSTAGAVDMSAVPASVAPVETKKTPVAAPAE